jgi:hydrogenase nickel incorporation protein HypA/HybF
MHEMALMGEILLIIQDDASKKGITRIEKVELTVGEISNAMPEALTMAFDIFKEQNPLLIDEDAQLVIHMEKAEAECILCSQKYVPSDRLAFCPDCDMPSGKIISGENFQILSYEGRGSS